MTIGTAQEWQVSRLSQFTRIRWLLLDIAFGALVAWVFFYVDPSLWKMPLGIIVAVVLIYSAVVLPFKRKNLKCHWNEQAIQVSSLLTRGKPLPWHDLKGIESSMHTRATILRFGAFRKIKIYWGYDRHRDIISLAERKREENARTSRG